MEITEATPEEVRSRLSKIKSPKKKAALSLQFLLAARESEICGKYFFVKEHLEKTAFEREPVALFKLKSAKLGGEIRTVAVPISRKYEPLTEEVINYIDRNSEIPVFNFSIWTLYRQAKISFKGLYYPIRSGRKIIRWSELATHGLRHIRSGELINDYNFDPIEAVMYCGWSPKEAGISPMVQRYASLQWRRYIPKLLTTF